MSCVEPVLVSAFDDRLAAESALDELRQAGFSRERIGFALRGRDVVHGGMITDATGTKDAKGAVGGFAAGGLIGGAIGAAAAATVPGIGPVLAGGILTGMLGGAAAGAATGGIFGAMAGLGLSEQEAAYFEREFKSGRAIITVQPGERTGEAVRILRKHGGYDATFRQEDRDAGSDSEPAIG